MTKELLTYARTFSSRIPFAWVVVALLSVELISFTAFNYGWLNSVLCVAIVVATLALSLYKLEWGVYIALVELFIGSKGYLFEYPVGDFAISVRLGIFLAVFAAYAVWLVRDREIRFFKWEYWKPFAGIIAVIAWGVAVALVRGNPLANIFFDANGYLFFGLVLPAVQAIRTREQVERLLTLFLATIVSVSIKTLVLLALFSQVELLEVWLPLVYRWVRDTGVGEITRFPNGFYRIFFQGHIYMLLGFFFVGAWLPYVLKEKQLKSKIAAAGTGRALRLYALFAVTILVIFMSYSRSFWVATVATGGLLLLALLTKLKLGWKNVAAVVAVIGITFVLDYAVIFGIVNLPIPGNIQIGAGSLITERTKDIGSEEAASSRWQLAPPLWEATQQHAVLGAGLGSTVTYISDDPRVREANPTGEYTTFSFEWGYLDLWYKFGIAGLLAFGYLFVALARVAWHRMNETPSIQSIESFGLLFATIALYATHIFTPYLNHPLGIGWLILAAIALTYPFKKA